nr:hypothetical protein [Tanacetum cinerariifolium]
QVDEAQTHRRAGDPRTQAAPVPAVLEPVVTAALPPGEHLQVRRVIKATTHDQAQHHDDDPWRGAGHDQHREGRHALHQIEGEPTDEDKGNRGDANQDRGLGTTEQARKHARHVQACAIERCCPGGHTADDRDQAHRQKEPAGRHGEQPADIVVVCNVLRRLGGDDGGCAEPEQERDQGAQLRQKHRRHDAFLRRLPRDIARPVAEKRAEGHRVAHGQQRSADERCPEAFAAVIQRAGEACAHRRKDDRPEHDAQQNRPDARLKRQAEQHRETAQHGSGESVGPAERQTEEVKWRGIALGIGDLLDAETFNSVGGVGHGRFLRAVYGRRPLRAIRRNGVRLARLYGEMLVAGQPAIAVLPEDDGLALARMSVFMAEAHVRVDVVHENRQLALKADVRVA